jgi:hypothetical protein
MANAPTAPGAAGAGKKASAPLSAIELRGTADVAAYLATLRAIGQSLAMEIDLTAFELQQKLERGGRGIDKYAGRMAARRVTRRFRRSAEHMVSAGDEAARAWAEYSKTYADLIHPEATRRQWQWTEGRRNTS